MIKIKSQKIIPNIPSDSKKVSLAITSEGDIASKFEFFAVFDFTGEQEINVQVASNIITDVFTHKMHDEVAGPTLQTLEKSIKECKEALHKTGSALSFNASAAVFKENYIYISIYGSSKALYLDGTQVVHVDTEKEGNFAGTTKKIEDGKVIVLCTEPFFKKFPPKSLTSLTKPISAQDLDELSSAVILKVDVVKPEVESEEKPVVEVAPEKVENKKTKLKYILIPVGIVLLLAATFFVAKNILAKSKPTSQTEPTQNSQPAQNTLVDEMPKNSEPAVQGELTKKLDEANKVTRVSAQVFYDISIADAKASPNELALGERYLATSDSAQGKIYISSLNVTKFEELPQLFPGVRNLVFEGDNLIFTDNEGVKTYSIPTKSVIRSYFMDPDYPTLGPTSEYLGFTYALSGNNLVKLSKTGTSLNGVLWLQKDEFETGLSIDIDGSIYVLFSNGDLQKYTAGNQDDFSIVGLDKPIEKPLKVVTNSDYKEIYVGDGQEGRILAFDTDGVLDFQIKPELGNEWDNLKSFDISANEKNFYILSGTKVYEFSL